MTRLTRPICKYFGSKWQASKYYPPPKYDLIVEPFAGSACYSCHYADRQIVLVDKDPDMVDLLAWLIQADPAEVLSLPVDLRIGSDIRELPISRGAQLLIRNWQRIGRSTCWTVSKWNNANQGLWSESVKQHLAENLPAIRHWKAICADYRDLPNTDATWFLDPPYQKVPPAYRRDIDCNTIDFKHLADWARSRAGQVIVCEQAGADWLPFREFRDLKAGTAGARGKSRPDKGVIWTNDQR